MAITAISPSSSLIFRTSPSHHTSRGTNHGCFVSIPKPSLILPCGPITLFTVSASRRSNNDPDIPSKKKKKKERLPQIDDAEEEAFDEDAIDALFDQLEDLKSGIPSDEDDDDLSEEDLDRLEQELAEAFGSSDELEDEHSDVDSEEDEDTDKDEEENEDKEESHVKLKSWQLRRLASALKIGRRKTSIKSLAGEVCLDRAVVLQLLRDPPPNLLLMSAALPDKAVPETTKPETESLEPSSESTEDVVKSVPEVKLPVHVMQSRWSMQKRLKKVQIETLERVYIRSKRPTNAMISSIVHVTNLPRKRVVEWFEEKRLEEGIPSKRVPYQRSAP